MNIFDERIHLLQQQMKKDGIKSYVIFATDPHMSEEAAPYFTRERFYFCSFKGNDGTLLVTQDHYYLYTDGRYWTQAEKELEGTECVLVYDGKANVPTLTEYIHENELYPLGLDASMLSSGQLKGFYLDKDHKIIQKSYRKMVKDLPSLPKGKIFALDASLLSTTREERISHMVSFAQKRGGKAILFTALDDIAYLLGYRGRDIEYTPVFYSYLYVTTDNEIHLFIDEDKLPENFDSDIIVHPYESFIPFLKERKDIPTVLDNKQANALICATLKNRIYATNPAYLEKSVKGEVEIENTKKIQAIDGLQVLKLMKYIDEHVKDGNLSELSCAKYLDDLRLQEDLCFDLSFTTISAVDENAAMLHYAPSEENNAPLKEDSKLLLVDSGGQYYGGTTDTTRTFLINPNVDEEVKHDYTLTLKSQIALTTTIFEKGCSGRSIDIKARQIMWDEGLDYKCGTGHGVGYISCVHEGPVGFRYYVRPGVEDGYPIQLGQIITVEPGVYKPHKHGIRLENNLLVVPACETSDGIFYRFETITYCPYDRRGINLDELTEKEIAWVDEYHKQCYELLSPLCKEDEDLRSYLREQCKPLRA